MTRTLSFIAAIALAACTVDATENVYRDGRGLTVDQHDGALLTGSFLHDGTEIGFRAVQPQALRGEVEVAIGDRVLAIATDAENGIIDMNAGDVAFTDAESAAMKAFAISLGDYLGHNGGEDAMHDATLMSAVSYWSQAPVGVAPPTETLYVETADGLVRFGYGDDGVKCRSKGSWVTAYWDDSSGQHSQSVKVGSDWGEQWNGDYDCMGKCGAGCSGSRYTQDCLEHDVCSKKNYSSSGGFDHNCGDEYWNAANDTTCFWCC
jgi:hypothetical protein